MTRALEGKVALVTGGSRGIGAAIAKRLGADGAFLAFTYASAQGKADEVVKAIEAAGGQALAIRADSANVQAVRDAVAETVRAFGRLDVLVSSAGILTMAPFDQFSIDDFDRMVAVKYPGGLRGGAGGGPSHGRGRSHHQHRKRQCGSNAFCGR
jgi:3-oxoacyl-[acyl-carrier protein] reductase